MVPGGLQSPNHRASLAPTNCGQPPDIQLKVNALEAVAARDRPEPGKLYQTLSSMSIRRAAPGRAPSKSFK